MKVSVFKNVFQKENFDTKPIEYIFEQIRTNQDYEILCGQIRNEPDKKRRGKLKEKVECFTTSGTFKFRKIDGLLQHSNLICIDFDDVGDINYYKNILCNDRYTFACFISISGKGLAVIVKIDGKKHREAFDGLSEYYFNMLGLPIDPACKDVTRLRLVSFDPEIHHNPDSDVFKQYPLKQKKNVPKVVSYIHINNFFEKLVFSINTDIFGSYCGWFEVGCSIASQYGEAGLQYFRHLSQFRMSSKSNFEALIDKQYKYCCEYTQSFTIGTFYYYARAAGYDISNKEDDSIAKAAYFAKTGGRDLEQAVTHIQKHIETPKTEEEIRAIVTTVFTSTTYDPTIKGKDDQEFTLFENLIEWLHVNYNLKRNEITKFVEDDGKELEETDFNSIYINAKKVFPKITYPDVFRIINSGYIKTYNPIKEYLESLKWDGYDHIRKIVESIGCPDTGTLPWRVEMFKHWLVGSIESIYGKKNDLFFLLSGVQDSGKTEFFRQLWPDALRRYFAESQLDEGKDDKLLMTQKMFIFDDEYSGKSKQDSKKMKLLLSSNYFTLRAPYGSKNTDYRRIASLCGTTNDEEVLNDPTGNRRFIVFDVTQQNDFEIYNKVNKEQLFAHAFWCYLNGYTSKISAEEKKLMHQFTFEKHFESTTEAEMIIKFFDTPSDEKLKYYYLTTTEIKDYIETHSKQKLWQRELTKQLKRLGFKRMSWREAKRNVRTWKVRFKQKSEQSDNPNSDQGFPDTNFESGSGTSLPF